MDKWIYRKTPDNSSRFILGETGEKNLICIGINPSTATPEILDNTLKKVKKIAHLNGYDGWVMVNVYPQRATNPNDMHPELNINLHNQNIEQIKELVNSHTNFEICAGWGTEIYRRPYLKDCLKDIAITIGLDKRWIHLHHLTKNQHPRHPLYLPANSIINDFNINDYLKINLCQ